MSIEIVVKCNKINYCVSFVKIKTIYHLSSDALSKLIGSPVQERDKSFSFWQRMSKVCISACRPLATYSFSASSLLMLYYYFLEAESQENSYFQLLGAASLCFGLMSYKYAIQLSDELKPLIPFKQYDTVSNDMVFVALNEIKEEMPEEFNTWLQLLSLTFEEALSFFSKGIIKGYCYGLVMSLMEQRIVDIPEDMIKNLSKVHALKKQIMSIMIRTGILETIEAKPAFPLVSFTQEKKRLIKQLRLRIYEHSQDCVVHSSAVPLNQGSEVFLTHFIESLTKSSYLPINQTNESFLEDGASLKMILPLHKFFPKNIQEKTSSAVRHPHKPVFKSLSTKINKVDFLEREKKLRQAETDRDVYIKEHSKILTNVNFLFIKLRIHEQDGDHALGIIIQAGRYFFFDPNIGLFECTSIQTLAQKIYLVISNLYSDFDLHRAELLVHIPISPQSEQKNSLSTAVYN